MRINVENYRRLIIQKARATYFKLPAQHKTWIDLDDLVQDGILFARYHVLPRFRPHRANFCTFLSTSLENYYRNRMWALYMQKRNLCQPVSLSTVQYRVGNGGQEDVEQEMRAVQALLRVAGQASPLLKKYLRHWLLVQGRMQKTGSAFTAVRSELLELSESCGLGREEFEFLLTHDSWRRRLQARVCLAIPVKSI